MSSDSSYRSDLSCHCSCSPPDQQTGTWFPLGGSGIEQRGPLTKLVNQGVFLGNFCVLQAVLASVSQLSTAHCFLFS